MSTGRNASSKTCATSIIDDHYQLIIFVMRMSRKHKGVVTKANRKALFVTLVDYVPRFEAR